ncbi:MAG: DUF1697 domain-containing protein [Verrucomicrobia bacterium]|nr:DUF1697 domain-containing protein [Verrucomicrobiota bacterium]
MKSDRERGPVASPPKPTSVFPIRHVLLLRGINVGKAKRIAMADLRTLVVELGGSDVATLLNSGNVVCTLTKVQARGFAAKLEQALAAKIGVPCRVLQLSASELAAILSKNPLDAASAEPSKLLVAVLANTAAEHRAVALAQQDWAPDEVAVGPRCLYIWCKAGILESKLAVRLLKEVDATTRNWATLSKLQGMVDDAA